MPFESRFCEALFTRSPRMENRPLWHGEHSVVLPTLGMIVPNWFLVVPRVHTFNFAQQPIVARQEISGLVGTIWAAVAGKGDQLLLFEHGAQHSGSAVGCGLDHAHLHVIVAPHQLAGAIWSAMERDLHAEATESSIDELLSGVDKDIPYYISWFNGRRLLEQPAFREVSQRFRRLIATVAGVPDCWNYREYQFRGNIANTIAGVRRHTPWAA